jgi:hypothetical protein
VRPRRLDLIFSLCLGALGACSAEVLLVPGGTHADGGASSATTVSTSGTGGASSASSSSGFAGSGGTTASTSTSTTSSSTSTSTSTTTPGPCLDTTADPHHCGACGHDCLGGACVDSACQPAVLYTSEHIRDLALNGTHLYWGEWSGALSRMPLPSGPSQLLTKTDVIDSIALSSTELYWVGSLGQDLWRQPLAGGTATKVSGAFVSALPLPHLFAVDAANVYYNCTSTQDLMVWGIGSISSNVLAHGLEAFTQIAVDATHVYYGTDVYTPPVELRRIPLAGGTPESCAQVTGVWAIALDDANVYWTAAQAEVGEPMVMSMPKTGGPPAVLVSTQAKHQSSPILAVDDAYVYWTQLDDKLARTPKTGGPSTMILDPGIPGYNHPITGVVVNETAIYISTGGSPAEILLLAK